MGRWHRYTNSALNGEAFTLLCCEDPCLKPWRREITNLHPPARPPSRAPGRAATGCLPCRPPGHGGPSGEAHPVGAQRNSPGAGQARRAGAERLAAAAGAKRSLLPPPASGGSPMGAAAADEARRWGSTGHSRESKGPGSGGMEGAGRAAGSMAAGSPRKACGTAAAHWSRVPATRSPVGIVWSCDSTHRRDGPSDETEHTVRPLTGTICLVAYTQWPTYHLYYRLCFTIGNWVD